MDLTALGRHIAAHYGRIGEQPRAGIVELMDLEIGAEGGLWRVYDTERGRTTHVHLETPSEAEACARFLEITDARAYLLERFVASADADQLEAILETAGLWRWRNDLPASMGVDERYRVFVRGRDLPRARALLAAR